MTYIFITLAVLFRALAYTMNRVEHGIVYNLNRMIESLIGGGNTIFMHPLLKWWHHETFYNIKGLHKSGNIMHWADHLSLFSALMAGLHSGGWKAWIACALWAFFSRWIASPAQYYINAGSGLPPNPGVVRLVKMAVGISVCIAAFWMI